MNDSTRDKILAVAHKLFADKGFNGASVREIASASDVNIAAINYHFTNKAGLYQQTILQSMLNMNENVKKIFDTIGEPDTETFTLEVFKFFMDNAEDLRTSFRLVMSTNENMDTLGDQVSEFKGPPGGEFFAQCLMKEYPNASEEDIQWAVRIIFTQIVHKAIIMCNTSICKSMTKIGMGVDVVKEDLSRLVKIIRKELS